MSVVPIRRKVLGDLVDTRLGGVTGAPTIYRGEIPDQPPLIMNGPNPDPSGRVAKHVVWYGGGGNPIVEQDIADVNIELDWSFTTICVAGYHDDCVDLVDDVTLRLHRWIPALNDHVFGRVKPPPGFDPGSPRRIDLKGLPPRFELPLLWRLYVTTS